MANYNSSRTSTGPKPALNGQSFDKAASAKSAVGVALDTVKSAAGNAGAATKSAVSSAAGTVSTATSTGAKTVGSVSWDIIQRNPLQALLLLASLIWLVRNNKTSASQPSVSIPKVGQKVGSVAGQVQTAASNLSSQVGEQAQRAGGWFGQTLQSSPLALGAMAIVFGAALGFAVP